MNEMRIYVASLSDYNDGRLEGKWLDLADYSDASELMEAIQEMLHGLTKKYNDGEVREEWAVHDYEGIPSTLASEYMGEQDFQQLYDIAEVAEDRGVPVEVLVERAGDTGSDDYQALADSLMFVVDGSDESDIVYEYEEQIGGLGNDFWSNHIYVDDVTERVMYSEDVDRFREDILYENPDMDEDEAERQAEEMADEEAERREDLTTYLEDMGYGDEIPNWVSKDYEGAWKRSLSYDLDVIHHDGEMYVFSNNYGVGGTILSGMIGAYIGYKVGRARPQKKGFSTEKRIGQRIKGAFSKKKMARGGRLKEGFAIMQRGSLRTDAFGKVEVFPTKEKALFKMSHVPFFKTLSKEEREKLIVPYSSSKMARGGGVYSSDNMYELKVFDGKSNEFLTSVRFRARNQREANEIGQDYEYEMQQKYGDYLRFVVSEAKPLMATGGGVSYNKNWEVVGITSNGKMFKETITLGRMSDKEDVINALNRRTDLNIREITSIKEVFADGGMIKVGDNVVITDDSNENYSDYLDRNLIVIDIRKDRDGDYFYDLEDEDSGEKLPFSFYQNEIELFAKGGGIGFKDLSNKVAKRYEGKPVPKEYQSEYGKRYSKSEAKEVGDKVAGKVYWQQQGRKMAQGGGISGIDDLIRG